MKKYSYCLIAGVALIALLAAQSGIVTATKVVKATKASGKTLNIIPNQ